MAFEEQTLHARIDALLDRGAEQGCLHISELDGFVQTHELDDEGVEELYDRLEARGIDVSDDCARTDAVDASYVNGELASATTDAL
jgi:RNA polymerase primary sigma factor